MKNRIFRTGLAAAVAALSVTTSAFAATDTNIDNEVILSYSSDLPSIITQVVTNVNIVNNIDVDVDASVPKDISVSIPDTSALRENSARLRAGLR